ncbi:hypothetical protein Sjap_018778 [Stephania japonica]|uniref:Uncharacterized protein n=1 Tax=Stephania japonica TaxID=461633 RepID=A0AAP0I8V5_9MAGN
MAVDTPRDMHALRNYPSLVPRVTFSLSVSLLQSTCRASIGQTASHTSLS